MSILESNIEEVSEKISDSLYEKVENFYEKLKDSTYSTDAYHAYALVLHESIKDENELMKVIAKDAQNGTFDHRFQGADYRSEWLDDDIRDYRWDKKFLKIAPGGFLFNMEQE